jgi:hypothetical protein
MIEQFSTVLLDMNNTFMFSADRFGSTEDYSTIYHQLGGTMAGSRVNQLIRSAYRYLGLQGDRYSSAAKSTLLYRRDKEISQGMEANENVSVSSS